MTIGKTAKREVSRSRKAGVSRRPRTLFVTIAGLLFAVFGGMLLAEKEGTDAAAPGKTAAGKPIPTHGTLIDEDHQRSVLAGIEHLARQQDPDSGAFGAEKARIAVTALGSLAFLAHGSIPGRGPHGETVEKALVYLLRHGRPPDAKRSDRIYFEAEGDDYSRMHGHGFATLALAEAYGMFGGRVGAYPPKEVHAKIQGAVNLIESSQTRDGGWGYYPENDGSHEGSITVCQVQALRSAKDAGFRVKIQTIEKALDYLSRSQDKRSGGFKYSLQDPKTSYALTAAAVSTLNALGVYDENSVDRGIDFMERTFEPTVDAEWFFYGNLYAAQAYYQHRRGRHWERWFQTVRKLLLDRQGHPEPGAWVALHRLEDYGSAYATACALLILQVPYQYLPIFQK